MAWLASEFKKGGVSCRNHLASRVSARRFSADIRVLHDVPEIRISVETRYHDGGRSAGVDIARPRYAAHNAAVYLAVLPMERSLRAPHAPRSTSERQLPGPMDDGCRRTVPT